MKRLIGFGLVLLIISIGIFSAACGSDGSSLKPDPTAELVSPTQTPQAIAALEKTEKEAAGGSLCAPEKKENIDFSVLNTDTRPALERGYMYQRLIELGKDEEARIARDASSAFLNALNVPLSNIPEWFIEMRDGAISQAEARGEPVDYGFLNDALDRFVEDPKYSHYADPEQKFKLFVAVNEGFIKAVGDPFAHLFTPESVKLGITDSTGTIFGIGANIGRNQNNEWELSFVDEGGPAEKADLKRYDILREVNGKSVEGCVGNIIIFNIRGKMGTEVVLTLERDGREFEVSVLRDLIKFELVESWPELDWPDGRGSTNKTLAYKFPLRTRNGEEAPGIAYIKIASFEDQAARDAYYVLRNLPWEKISGLIIDLRNNPGGSLRVIEAIAGYFLPSRSVILWREEAGGQRKVSRVVGEKQCYGEAEGFCFEPNIVPEDLPVVALVNRNSFSGSEVMAGALQDYGRATLVGERTGGKGTVNQYFPLRQGEYGVLYLATELWKTPNGRLIEPLFETEEGGLLPDVVIEQPLRGFEPDNDENIFRALEILLEEIEQSK